MTTATSRKAPREHRRQQIIDATVVMIARQGMADITLSQIAKTAGVSHGLVNFHFESKEKLLAATLQYLSDEYTAAWIAEAAQAGSDAALQLDAMLRADLGEAIHTPDKIAAWSAFWGEAKTRPVYRQIRAPVESQYEQIIAALCATLNTEGGYSHEPARAAHVIHSLVDSNWLDPQYDDYASVRDDKLKTMYCLLSAFFPKHFSADGPLRR